MPSPTDRTPETYCQLTDSLYRNGNGNFKFSLTIGAPASSSGVFRGWFISDDGIYFSFHFAVSGGIPSQAFMETLNAFRATKLVESLGKGFAIAF